MWSLNRYSAFSEIGSVMSRSDPHLAMFTLYAVRTVLFAEKFVIECQQSTIEELESVVP